MESIGDCCAARFLLGHKFSCLLPTAIVSFYPICVSVLFIFVQQKMVAKAAKDNSYGNRTVMASENNCLLLDFKLSPCSECCMLSFW
jgi:hypothetical protein